MGMSMNNIRMTTTVPKSQLLDTLRKNLEKHSMVVREARAGYLKKAEAALEERLKDLRTGKTLSLAFSLNPPLDYSEVYRSTIKMLEWNTMDKIELQADEFRQLVEDKWEWSRMFFHQNKDYSSTASLISDRMSEE